MTDTAKEVAFKALREMYSEAEPPLDFDAVVENPDEFDEDWYSNYELSSERQREIFEKHAEKSDLSETERRTVKIIALLYYAPASGRGDE